MLRFETCNGASHTARDLSSLSAFRQIANACAQCTQCSFLYFFRITLACRSDGEDGVCDQLCERIIAIYQADLYQCGLVGCSHGFNFIRAIRTAFDQSVDCHRAEPSLERDPVCQPPTSWSLM